MTRRAAHFVPYRERRSDGLILRGCESALLDPPKALRECDSVSVPTRDGKTPSHAMSPNPAPFCNSVRGSARVHYCTPSQGVFVTYDPVPPLVLWQEIAAVALMAVATVAAALLLVAVS